MGGASRQQQNYYKYVSACTGFSAACISQQNFGGGAVWTPADSTFETPKIMVGCLRGSTKSLT